MKRLPGTWCGFLQRVPAVEGPLFLLAQVGAMLEQPMGDPALADPWRAASHQITKVFCKKKKKRKGSEQFIHDLWKNGGNKGWNSAKMAHFNHLWLDSGWSFVLIAALLTVLISKQSLQSETVFKKNLKHSC